jgi:sugar/nucleoside kinase (ribokinase family)
MTTPILVIGNLNVDLIMGPQEPWPMPGTEVILPDGDLRVGGAAGNTALALQAIGAPYRLVANRGQDVFGAWLAAAFPDQDEPATTRAATTISVGITHPDGERTFFTTAGHLGGFDWACVEGQLPASGSPGALALLCGTFVTPALLPDYRKLVAELCRRRFTVVLDTGWPPEGWSEAVCAEVRGWLPDCGHLLLNEVEAQGLAGVSETDAAARSILSGLAQDAVLVIKCGPAGALVFHRAERFAVPAPAVEVVDTIGAGDAFNAGYLSGLTKGCSPQEAATIGVNLASLAVSTKPRRYRP